MAAPIASPLTAVVARAARLHPISCSASTSKNSKQSPPPPQKQMPRPSVAPLPMALVAAAAPLLLAALPPPDALAVGGELGIIEGTSVALLHPIIMGGLFAYTLWAGYLGWQWRRVRTVQDEINELKKQLKPAAAAVAVGAGDSASPPSSRRQVANRDQDRRAHRGAEEAGEGVVQGQALQRGVDPAGAGRHGVRRRRAQHLAPHREALSRPAPVRRRGHHRALGGGRGACPGDAEGERDRQEPAHRAQHHQRPALHLADPHGARHRPQGLRVHQMAMSSYRTIPLGSRLVHRHPARFFV